MTTSMYLEAIMEVLMNMGIGIMIACVPIGILMWMKKDFEKHIDKIIEREIKKGEIRLEKMAEKYSKLLDED
jgi:uncharacterized C2H2 Zn-finger protein